MEKTSGSVETRNDSVGNPSKSMLHGAGSIPILSFTAMKSAECSRDWLFGLDRDMAKKELNLLQFAARRPARAGRNCDEDRAVRV